MDKMIGFAFITTEDYERLLRENEETKIKNKILEERLENQEKQFESIETAILKKVYIKEKYHIENYDGEYHHNELVKAFVDYGYSDMNKIDTLIKRLIEKYNAEEIVSVEEL